MVDARIGRETPPFPVRFDEFRNDYYLEATHEDQPVFLDDDAARAAGLAARAVPATRFFGPTTPGFPDPLTMMELSFQRALLAGASYEFDRLPLLGESFTGQGRISSVVEKATDAGTMYIVVMEVTYTDNDGATVATEKLTFIERP
jgi:N-terminal half of MaoC dehydratase